LTALKSVSLNDSQNGKETIIKAEVGEDKSLSCNYESKQPYGITWYKATKKIRFNLNTQVRYAFHDPRKVLARNGSLIIREVIQDDEGVYRCEYGYPKRFDITRLLVAVSSNTPVNKIGVVKLQNKVTSAFPSLQKNLELSISTTQIVSPVTVSTTYNNITQRLSSENKINGQRNDRFAENWKVEGDNKKTNEAQEKWLVIFSVLLTIFLSIIVAIFILLFIEMYRDKKSKLANPVKLHLNDRS